MLSMTASSKQSEMEGKRLSYSELVGYLQVNVHCTMMRLLQVLSV